MGFCKKLQVEPESVLEIVHQRTHRRGSIERVLDIKGAVGSDVDCRSRAPYDAWTR